MAGRTLRLRLRRALRHWLLMMAVDAMAFRLMQLGRLLRTVVMSGRTEREVQNPPRIAVTGGRRGWRIRRAVRGRVDTCWRRRGVRRAAIDAISGVPVDLVRPELVVAHGPRCRRRRLGSVNRRRGLDQLRLRCDRAAEQRRRRLDARMTRSASAYDIADGWRRAIVSPRNTCQRLAGLIAGHNERPVRLRNFSPLTRFFHYRRPWLSRFLIVVGQLFVFQCVESTGRRQSPKVRNQNRQL